MTTAPTDCIQEMLAATMDLAGRGVQLEFAELGTEAGVWNPDRRTLQLDSTCPMVEQARVLKEFQMLCNGRGEETRWENVRPPLRLVR